MPVRVSSEFCSIYCKGNLKYQSPEMHTFSTFYLPINIHGPFFWPIWLKLSEIVRNGQSGIPLFLFLWENFLLLSYVSFKIFQRFCRIYTTFLFFYGFSYCLYCRLAAVLLNTNPLEFLKCLYLFFSFPKNIFFCIFRN